jgi:hypothetical protein
MLHPNRASTSGNTRGIHNDAERVIDMYRDDAGYAEKLALFRERFEQACSVVPEEALLLYRLDPQTTPSEDPIGDLTASRFGGLPDLRRFFYAGSHYDKEDEKRYEREWRAYTLNPMDPNRPPQPASPKVNLPPLAEWIEKTWPRCNCCNRPMQFIGQVELTEWLIVLLNLTYKKEGSYGAYTGATNKRVVEYSNSHRTWLYFFKCEDRHWEEPSSDARVMIATMVINPRDGDTSAPAWTDEEFSTALTTFANKHEVTGLPSALVTGCLPKFDVEHNEASEDLDTWELQKAHPELFGRDCNFQLFGEEQSQQEPKRFFCTNSYDGPHYQAPILSWDDDEHDITHQMYGCTRCVGIENTIWAKMDSSNT